MLARSRVGCSSSQDPGESMRLWLCMNCLQSGAKGVDVGPDKGSQRDPYRESIPLCEICEGALLEGNFEVLAARHTNERVINRADATENS